MCGYQTGQIRDASRSNWQNDAGRPISWSAWYPTEKATGIEREAEQFFEMGAVTQGAALIRRKKLPVVLLSHGTGGTAESLGWLARALACEGYVVLAANHHGNTGLEPYLPEGFLCWWERAADLSFLLTSLGNAGFFANSLDLDRVSAIGFSLGGYAVLALAGAQTSMDAFNAWRRENNVSAKGPREFPNVTDSIPSLLEMSEAFRLSWLRHADDYTDNRVKSVVAIAPAPTVRSFVPQSVSQISLPVTILTGGADHEAPSEHCSDWLIVQNPSFKHHDLGGCVGHYTFLEFPSDNSLNGKIDIFSDHESIDRQKVHAQAKKFVFQALN